jgi:diguanylate cyclase (GGDEF)-like protein
MVISIPGYTTVEAIVSSGSTKIFRGIRLSDSCPIVIKLLNQEYPTTKERTVFLREYDILNKINGDGIIKVFGVEKYRNSLAIILEDIDGESVDRICRSADLEIFEKLALAIQITESIVQIHQQNIIHKDINPSNIIWNRSKNQVKLIDFGIAAELLREASQCVNLNILEGTLNYMSPEQTGRINRPVDYRTDLYSLGITLYELFTGKLPFSGNDELEIIYCHIAKMPIPPVDINPQIPPILSNIIMKLISKTAEERYQSAYGLLRDLEFCQQNPDDSSLISNTFIPGRHDHPDRFEIPHALYGREAEVDLLIKEFETAADGYPEILLVSGYSGIGKSSLINEIRKPITGKKGYFIFGKYNQFERNIPYYGITQAFKEFLKQLLAESSDSLDKWKQELILALGNNGQVAIDIIPDLEKIIGPQPEVPELYPLEAQNRFLMTFCEFINVFAKREHPLVVFLDDLQWSDRSSLDLIKHIISSNKVRYVLFIGAYRDREVEKGHMLLQLLDEINNHQNDSIPPVKQIYLKPLDYSSVNKLIAGTLHRHPDTTGPLTNVVLQKTKGNPFFVNRLLYSLYQQGTFTFRVDEGQWDYDLEKVNAVDISENVVDLLVKGLTTLGEDTLDILKLLSCIGNQFDLLTVSLISKKPVATLGRNLWIAIENEIILPLNNNYRFINIFKNEINPVDFELRFCFAHDRIRQAVYSLISESRKCEFNLSIGREYLRSFRVTRQMDTIFDLVRHLNSARCLITGKEERFELADLNSIAGNKAMKSTAFAAALSYFESAEALLSRDEWSALPDKYFELVSKEASTALLSGDLVKADSLCEMLSTVAKSKLETGTVTHIKVMILIFQGKLPEAISEVRKTLQLFSIILPESAEEITWKTQDGIMKMQQILTRMSIDELVNLPVMNDPEIIMALQLLQTVLPASQSSPSIFALITLVMFELTLTYGTSSLSCKCFGDCGHILGKVLADYKTGYKLGEAAFALINKYNAESQKASVYFIFSYISFWQVHYKESLDYFQQSYKTGIETGDLIHAMYAIAHKVHLQLWVGNNLIQCKLDTENAIVFLKQVKGTVPLLLAEIVYYTIQKFLTIPSDSIMLQKTDVTEFNVQDTEMIEKITNIKSMQYMRRFYHHNTFVNIVLGNMEEAEKWSLLIDKVSSVETPDFSIPDYYLFKGLIIVSKWNDSSDQQHITMKETLCTILQKLKIWAENCPANFAHKYYLLSEQIAIIEHDSLDTIVDLFGKTIESFGENDFIHHKALCNELYGKFWIDKGVETIGKAYIREAYYLYKQWGAHRKVALMEKQYTQFFIANENVSAGHEATKIKKGSTSVSPRNSIDLVSILKSSQAISSEIKIDKLLKILIHTMIENAGAQRGCLLLKNETDNQFYIEAIQDGNSFMINSMQSALFTDSIELCPEIVHFVIRTMESVVIKDASSDSRWQNSTYIIDKQIKSVLCMPVIYQNRLKGVVYLENNLSDNVFTSERLELLNILSSQASISIENARLYENVEEKVRERTIQLNDANEKLKELSLHDPLTNLYNRRYVFEFIGNKLNVFVKNKAISLHKQERRRLASNEDVIGIYLIDIDHFKMVNDTYGHSAGDTVLITLSEVLNNMIRSEDCLIRWGGEEFLIILYNTKPGYLDTFSKKILETIEKTPIRISESETIHKSCSVGFVQMPLDLTNPLLLNLEQMINLSDYALYYAKEHGRSCASRFKIKNKELDDSHRAYLANLSKSNRLNEEYFYIECFRS